MKAAEAFYTYHILDIIDANHNFNFQQGHMQKTTRTHETHHDSSK